MLDDEPWRGSERQVQRITSAVFSDRPERATTPPSLPNLRFLSVQMYSGSSSLRSALPRLVQLLVDSPLHYFGCTTGAVLGVPASTSMLPLPLIAMLAPLPLVGLACATPPLLHAPPLSAAMPIRTAYSRQWVESEEAKARRERRVLTEERLSDEEDSDEHLLYDWMTRHRYSQHNQYAHVFNDGAARAAYFTAVSGAYCSGSVALVAGTPTTVGIQRRRPNENGVHSGVMEASVDDDDCCWICCSPLRWLCHCFCQCIPPDFCGDLCDGCDCADCDCDEN